MTPYDVLEVPPDAPPAAVKRAYRRKAKQVHSDKGGNDEEMRRLNHAYAIVSDPVRRQRFDQTGFDGEAMPDEAERNLERMFGELIDSRPPEEDLVALLLKSVRKTIAQVVDGERACLDQLKKTQAVVDRLMFKGDGRNVLLLAAESRLAGVKTTQANLAQQKVVGERMMELLKGYRYRSNPIIQPTTWRTDRSMFFEKVIGGG